MEMFVSEMRDTWRKTILEELVPNIAKLTLVFDPDYLLTEEKLAMELYGRGFHLIELNDSIEFRYTYESKYRPAQNPLNYHELIVISRLQAAERSAIPYDILKESRQLSFNLGDVFPSFSYPVIDILDRSLLDLLFDAYQKKMPDRMGENATKDFILFHVFEFVPEHISTEVELLHFLLHLHYENIVVPNLLAERMVELLEVGGKFKNWSLLKIILDAKHFFDFIQERWPIFLKSFSQSNQVNEKDEKYRLKVDGPVVIPFEHQSIRVYINNLFIEGMLTPVKFLDLKIDDNEQSWILSGISVTESENDDTRISGLFKLIDEAELSESWTHADWISLAIKWAELSSLIHTLDSNASANINERYTKVRKEINKLFADWMCQRFDSLINLPPSTPAMLHHVPRCMARSMEIQKNNRLALVVIDGLSLNQWATVRNIVQKQNPSLNIRESATFAWVPTVTSVSRQSIFSGKVPRDFPTSINTTHKEEKLWESFWHDNGVSKHDIAYKRSLGKGDAEADLDSLINPEHNKVVGLVIDTVDKIMHGMELGAQGMHNQISQWCNNGYLISLLNYLNNMGYEIWITSDHGNIESVGKGRPSEGAIAESRGERTRVYPTRELRSQVSSEYSFAREWDSSGLPENYFPLVTINDDAFIRQGDTIVGHGGIAIEEVIVPLIKIERKL